ncbi:MAG: TetR/AcrR family transcriptional regulator [Candidatus Pristimantibacillus sp.]
MNQSSQPPTADRIKQAAVTMFTESGYEGTSMSEIAKEVGIKTPSIYAHFKSKEQLFLQLLEEGIADERSQFIMLSEATKQEQVWERLYKVFDFFTDYERLTAGQAFLKRTMLVPPRHLRDHLSQQIISLEAEMDHYLKDMIHQGQNDGSIVLRDAEEMIALLYNGVDGLLVEYQIYNDSLFNKRKQMVWRSFMRTWTTTDGKD